ncbi:hypothetical protein ZWY2020_024171 [Hordeum vulgare]|nr:hypothetical protein ZWY2020_024171 [Hordeum vulgare]
MEGVEDKLKRLNLSKAERKGLKIGWRRVAEKNDSVAKAMGKLFSDRPGDVLGEDLQYPTGNDVQGVREDLAAKIGELMEVDGEEDGTTLGKCLRVKVRIIVAEPLMRGLYLDVEPEEGGSQRGTGSEMEVTIFGDEKGEEKKDKRVWCYFEYEYLPDMCFSSGRLRHLGKDYRTKQTRGENAKFGRWLRYVPDRAHVSDVGRGNWKENSGGSSGKKYGWLSNDGKSRSDVDSWKKSAGSEGNEGKKNMDKTEVTSPLKITITEEHRLNHTGDGKSKKTLNFGASGIEQGTTAGAGNKLTGGHTEKLPNGTGGVGKVQEGDGRDGFQGESGLAEKAQNNKQDNKKGRNGKFKRLPRASTGAARIVVAAKNRKGEDMDKDLTRGVKGE